jgi:hypothetical protein
MMATVETWYPRRRDVPRNFLDSVVGDTQRQRENKAVADVVAASSVEDDLSRTLNVSVTCVFFRIVIYIGYLRLSIYLLLPML